LREFLNHFRNEFSLSLFDQTDFSRNSTDITQRSKTDHQRNNKNFSRTGIIMRFGYPSEWISKFKGENEKSIQID